jgi:hypothetical protein
MPSCILQVLPYLFALSMCLIVDSYTSNSYCLIYGKNCFTAFMLLHFIVATVCFILTILLNTCLLLNPVFVFEIDIESLINILYNFEESW